MMKLYQLLVVSALAAATGAVSRRVHRSEEATSLISLSETEQQWVTDDEKRELRLAGTKFIDKTFTPSLGTTNLVSVAKVYTYPTTTTHAAAITPLFDSLSTSTIEDHLTTFSTFQNRFYKGGYGAESSAWLLSQVNDTLISSGVTSLGATVTPFEHSEWDQDTIIATIPGKSASTIVIGAHQDSVNWRSLNQQTSRAPGADDNGSGSMTILEALRVYLTSETVLAGEAENTVEFHWYAAEEAGLLGSQAVFEAYADEGRDVLAMLEQDMTGYTAGMTAAGEEITLGVVTDYVDEALTEFIKMIVDQYVDIPYSETECGYAW